MGRHTRPPADLSVQGQLSDRLCLPPSPSLEVNRRRCLPLLLPGLSRSSAGVGCSRAAGGQRQEQRRRQQQQRRRRRAGLSGGARLAEGDAVIRIASERI